MGWWPWKSSFWWYPINHWLKKMQKHSFKVNVLCKTSFHIKIQWRMVEEWLKNGWRMVEEWLKNGCTSILCRPILSFIRWKTVVAFFDGWKHQFGFSNGSKLPWLMVQVVGTTRCIYEVACSIPRADIALMMILFLVVTLEGCMLYI